MLACSNFHYLLGYFRNYNKYKSEGASTENPGILDVLDIVRMDVEVSSPPVRVHEGRANKRFELRGWTYSALYRSPYEYLNPNAYICWTRTGR